MEAFVKAPFVTVNNAPLYHGREVSYLTSCFNKWMYTCIQRESFRETFPASQSWRPSTQGRGEGWCRGDDDDGVIWLTQEEGRWALFHLPRIKRGGFACRSVAAGIRCGTWGYKHLSSSQHLVEAKGGIFKSYPRSVVAPALPLLEFLSYLPYEAIRWPNTSAMHTCNSYSF